MKQLLTVLVIAGGLSLQLQAADVNELAGRWVGEVVSPKGQMEIGLDLRVAKGQLVGVLQTGHGAWEITAVTEQQGLWKIEMKSPDGPAWLSGRVTGTRFAGDWHAPMTSGPFEVTRSKKQYAVNR